jgi:hypothetical protein
MARFVFEDEDPATPAARFVFEDEPAPAGAEPSALRSVAQGAGNLVAGAVRGAGSIGATILAPYDIAMDALDGKGLSLESNRQRRADMDAGLRMLGAETDSWMYQGGKLATEIAGTAAVPGLAAGGAKALGAAPKVVTALASGGGKVEGATRLARTAMRTGAGAAVGGASAAMVDPSMTAGGAGVGGVLTAALGPVLGKIGRAIAGRSVAPSAAEAATMAVEAVQEAQAALQREGVALSIPQLSQLRDAVEESIKAGKSIDAAALARKLDFEALGMKPTLGQITRDPATYSREKNLRGVAGVGEPLLQRFGEQSRRMQEVVGDFSRGAQDTYGAGDTIIGALKKADDEARAPIAAAYDLARDQAGRSAPMESFTFSRLANGALDEQMLSAALPVEARQILNDVTLGKIPLTVNSAEMIKTRLSGMARDLMAQGKKEGALAVGKLRDAIEQTPIEGAAGQEAKAAFDAARNLARDRFSKLEAVPALKAAAEGDVYAQDFVGRYLLGGKAEEVSALAKALPAEAKAEARRQFGAAIGDAAFGQNVAGDAAFSPERFSRFLTRPGMRQKLAAFFSPAEMETLDRVQRVGAYRSSFPADSTVNTSNTAAAVVNLLAKIPGIPSVFGLVSAAKNAAANHVAVRSSIAALPPRVASKLSPSQEAALAEALGLVTPAGSVTLAPRNALVGGGPRLSSALAEEDQ